jgi:starch phosphorylase
MVKALRSFRVTPKLPEPLVRLKDIAMNMWWCWNYDAVNLFQRLDRELWEKSHHNPVALLGMISQDRLEKMAKDDGYLAQLDHVYNNLVDYLDSQTWFSKGHFHEPKPLIAYFSMEFGLNECLPIYSGGLGILAGDHLKSASELGLPMVGIGLLYQQGYFQQYLNKDGWQQEFYPSNDFYNLPLELAQDSEGRALKVSLNFPGRTVVAQVWKLMMGRLQLFLMDTNLPENNPLDRRITNQLYGGDRETRIQQEYLLGIGGVKILEALDIDPIVYHMNEGHSAFLALERMARHIEQNKLDFNEAFLLVKQSTVFTTHTPVPAGIDEFPPDLVDKYFKGFPERLHLSSKEFMDLGHLEGANPNAPFNMALLAINCASFVNGVSRLHGEVSRKMFSTAWKNIPDDEVPISSITNGVHTRSWISHEMATLYDRYLGPSWISQPADQTVWERVDNIPDEELWQTHERRRERLIAFARRTLKAQLERRGALNSELDHAQEVLNPDVLTIGFARRFATYKRGNLFLYDLERLKRILCNKERPMQIIIAGKAHPRDNEGKELIKQIVHVARDEQLRRHIVFLENYDINLARYLVQGVDVWLNNPLRPMEASGTSGMKVVFNGGINVSTLDGWWVEGYTRDTGWSIGMGEVYDNLAYQNQVEANALYDLLEKEIGQLFYERGADDLPRKWIAKMKGSMRGLCPRFNTNRMVKEYTEKFYLPAFRQSKILQNRNMAELKSLSVWHKRMQRLWHQVKVVNLSNNLDNSIGVGDDLEVNAWVHLGDLKPDDVMVQLLVGSLDADGEIMEPLKYSMNSIDKSGDGSYNYNVKVSFGGSGNHGFTVRVLPNYRLLLNPYELGLICWADKNL